MDLPRWVRDMEVWFMHFSHRRIIVTVCFGVWMGAAGLICHAFVTRPLEGDEIQVKSGSPAEIVRAASVGIEPVRVALAQR
jgi:hypothetical protein